MSEPKFIITRFAHGTAGKFLSTVLQTSNQIDHWSAILQKSKETSASVDVMTLQYVKRSFPSDHSLHLQSEPMVPYCTDLYSTGYSRGDDITLEQYLTHAKTIKDIRLQSCIDKQLVANLVFNKPQTPIFCQGANVVTVLIQNEIEIDWACRTLWSKHFLEIDQHIHYLPSDPDYCNFSSLETVLKFQNNHKYKLSDKDIIFKNNILNKYVGTWFNSSDNFAKFDYENQLNNAFISLSDFFDTSLFVNAMTIIFDQFNLGTLNIPLVTEMHKIWWSKQLQL